MTKTSISTEVNSQSQSRDLWLPSGRACGGVEWEAGEQTGVSVHRMDIQQAGYAAQGSECAEVCVLSR